MERDAHVLMRTLTVNKFGRQSTAICLFCNKTEIPLTDWNKRCSDCKQKLLKEEENEQQKIRLGLLQRTPAAIIKVTESNNKEHDVYVDKFGVETDNPGYDLKNDPRGWGKTGNVPAIKKRDVLK